MLVAVLLTGLALRLGYVWSLRGDVLFEHPALDEQRYADAARALAAGQPDPERGRAYWQPPGVIYVTAAVMVLAGPGLLAPRVVQAILSTVCCLLLFALGRRLFSTRVALMACALLALHGVLIFAGAELLPATWVASFDLLALWLLVDERRTVWRVPAAGLTLGISALFSPVILLFVPVAAWVVRRPMLIALLVGGVIVPIVPVAVRNFEEGGEPVLLSTNGGLNLFIGNNEHYPDTFALRPGRHWEELTREPEAEGVKTPGAASSWFAQKALAFVRAEPARAVELLGRKLYLYFNGAEIPRDGDLYSARSESPLLSLLVWRRPLFFPDGIVIPLALVGAALLWRERRRLSLIYLFVGVQAAVTAAFFVTARHRLPARPLLALFAAAGAGELSRLRRAGPLLVLLALTVALNLPTREAALTFAAERDFYRGVAWLRDEHNPSVAAGWFRRAADADPSDARSWFELGNSLDAIGDSDHAVESWSRAALADPWDSRARRRIAALLARRGDVEGAISALEANIDSHAHEPAHYVRDWLNLAYLYAERGQLDRARQAVDAARQADANYFQEHAATMATGLPPSVRSALGL